VLEWLDKKGIQTGNHCPNVKKQEAVESCMKKAWAVRYIAFSTQTDVCIHASIRELFENY
jgi:hypothetical protein